MLKIRLFERSIIPKRNYHGILKSVQVNRAFMKVFFFQIWDYFIRMDG